MNPLANGPYQYIQSKEWGTSQVVLDTTKFPPEDEVSMVEGTHSIVYNKYAKTPSDLDI